MAGRRLIVTRTPSSPCSAALFGVRRTGVGEELHQIVAWHQARQPGLDDRASDEPVTRVVCVTPSVPCVTSCCRPVIADVWRALLVATLGRVDRDKAMSLVETSRTRVSRECPEVETLRVDGLGHIDKA
jgi:hypothetical protein